jgi:hypothetical protein
VWVGGWGGRVGGTHCCLSVSDDPNRPLPSTWTIRLTVSSRVPTVASWHVRVCVRVYAPLRCPLEIAVLVI